MASKRYIQNLEINLIEEGAKLHEMQTLKPCIHAMALVYRCMCTKAQSFAQGDVLSLSYNIDKGKYNISPANSKKPKVTFFYSYFETCQHCLGICKNPLHMNLDGIKLQQ